MLRSDYFYSTLQYNTKSKLYIYYYDKKLIFLAFAPENVTVN